MTDVTVFLGDHTVEALVEALEGHGFEAIFGRYDYQRTLRKAAAQVIVDERARHLTLRNLRHAALTDLAAERRRRSGPGRRPTVALKLERKLEQSKIPNQVQRLYPAKTGMDA